MTTAAQNSKQILAQKGTAATPSFSFLGGNATGMYLAGTNQLGFSTAGVNAVTIDASQNVTVTGSFITPTIAGGSTASSTLTLESTTGAGTSDSILFKTASQQTRMTIDTSGNVGIGTTPAYKLDVLSTSFTGGRLSASTGTNGVDLAFSNTGGAFQIGIDSSTGANFGAAYGGFLWHPGAYPISFGTSNTERMRIDSSGNMLLGTTTSNGKLSVTTTTNYAGLYVTDGTYSGAITPSSLGGMALVSNGAYPQIFYVNSGERMRIDSSGNVGIGTSSFSTYPSSKLVTYAATGDVWNSTDAVAATGASGFHFYNNGVLRGEINTGGTSFASWGGASSFNFLGFAAAPMTFATNSTERMRIDSSGNVGIGCTPGYTLDVVGSLIRYAASTTSGYALMQLGRSATATQNWHLGSEGDGTFNWYNGNLGAGAKRMTIDASGNVGIGTSSPGQKLEINGNIQVQAFGQIQFYNSNYFIRAFSGLELQAIDYLRFLTGGANERMRIDSSGNVGIGFSSGLGTYGQLEIGGNTNPTMALRSSSASGTVFAFTSVGATEARVNAITNVPMTFFTNNTERMRIDANGNVIAGASAALATTATNGFLYVPTCAGTPTGTPTTVTGMAPIVVNTTNNKLYFYSGGAWRDAGP